jgi:hypothetical protein
LREENLKLSEMNGIVKHVVKLAKKASKHYFVADKIKKRLLKNDFKGETPVAVRRKGNNLKKLSVHRKIEIVHRVLVMNES